MISATILLLADPLKTGDLPVGWATAALATATVILGGLNWWMIRQMKIATKGSERPACIYGPFPLVWTMPSLKRSY